jgi:hypothetical protein
VALILGLLVLSLIEPKFDTFGLFHPPQLAQQQLRPTADPKHEAGARERRREDAEHESEQARLDRKEAEVRRREREVEQAEARRREREAEQAKAREPEQKRTDVAEEKTSEGTPKTKRRSTVLAFDIPEQIQLPELAASSTVDLCKISADDLTIGLHNPDGNPRKFQINPTDDKKSWLVMCSGKEVAKIERQDENLRFSWAEDVNAEAECFRNALLTFSAGGTEKVARLRETKTDSLTTLDLDQKTMQTIPLDVDLRGLDSKKLQLELRDISAAHIVRYEPVKRTVVAGKKVRAFVRDEWPFAAFDVSLFNTGARASLRVEPVMSVDSKELRWTVDSVNKNGKNLDNTIKAAKSDWPILKKTIPTLQNEINTLRKIPESSLKSFDAMNGLAVKIPILEKQLLRYNDIEQNLPMWEKQFAAMTQLAQLGNKLNRKAKFHFRVFYTVGGREVDVFVAE